jgi:hypothetical protein
MFLMWFDDSKKPTAQKIAEACARYQERYGAAPNTVLCNPEQIATVAGVAVRPLVRIRPNNFHIGVEV